MSDSVLSAVEGQAAAPDSTAQPSAGTQLRLAREAQGLHIAALAVALKVPVKKLEALEADRFDLLPDTVFVRALAASICRTLKIDATPILEKLPVTAAPQLRTDQAGINTPFRVPGQGASGLAVWDQLSRPVVIAVLVLLVGVVVVVFFPFNQLAKVSHAATSGVMALTSQSAPSTPVAAENPVAKGEEALTPMPSSVSTAISRSEPSLPMYPAVPAPAAALPVPAVNALAVAVPESGAAAGMLIIRAHESSWVEVVDASGVVQVRKTMRQGETLGTSGAVPLSVVIGRADAVTVEVRGKPFELTRLVKENVARFEVK